MRMRNGESCGSSVFPKKCCPYATRSGKQPYGYLFRFPELRRVLGCLRYHRTETQDGEAKEQGPDDRYRKELRPDHVEPGAAVENCLRERDEMRRRRYLHEFGEPWRHALQRRIAAREHVHGQKDQHVQQAELGHRPRNRAEKKSDRGRLLRRRAASVEAVSESALHRSVAKRFGIDVRAVAQGADYDLVLALAIAPSETDEWVERVQPYVESGARVMLSILGDHVERFKGRARVAELLVGPAADREERLPETIVWFEPELKSSIVVPNLAQAVPAFDGGAHARRRQYPSVSHSASAARARTQCRGHAR